MALYAATILTQSSTKILSFIDSVTSKFAAHGLLYTVSANIPADNLTNVVDSLRSSFAQSAGCISPSAVPGGCMSCSVAVFDSKSVIFFRSTLPGRTAPQVGRWHAFRKKDQANEPEPLIDTEFNWNDVWQRGNEAKPPSELERLNPKDTSAIFYLTDSSPEGLSLSLNAFPHAHKVGLIASPTPFITGRPFTLFQNDKIYDSGAVGLALLHQRNVGTPRLSFPGLEPVSPLLAVTQSEGNLITRLDNKNPTQLLLSHLHSLNRDLTSLVDEDFYVGSVTDGEQHPAEMYTISAGDPSRGTISLKTQTAPPPGTKVQFYHRSKPEQLSMNPLSTDGKSIKMRFSTVSESEQESAVTSVNTGVFSGYSESGLVLSQGTRPWTCGVPGTIFEVDLPGNGDGY